jgi:hypothetical protein
MASDYVKSLLGDNERLLVVTRQHWFVLVGSIFLEIIIILVLMTAVGAAAVFFNPLAAVGFVLLLIPLAYLVRDTLGWFNRQYIITNRRVMQIAGIFSKEVVDSSLEKVNDVKMSQSFFGRLFGYGDIEILTASELGANLFKRIGDPVHFKTAMLNAKERLGFDEDELRPRNGDDIPALIAELDDLRQRGILSQGEFERKKAELLSKM